MAVNAKYKEDKPLALRVLCVNSEGSVAGAEQSLLLFVQFMPKHIQISAACPPGILATRLRSLGARTYPISSPPRKFNLLFFQLFYLAFVNFRLLLIVLKVRPQIIHANSSKAVLAAFLAKILSQTRIIWHMRDLRISRLQAKTCACLSSKIIAVSQAVKTRLTELSVKPELIEVIYNGINADNIKLTEKKQNDCLTFANIGQFVPWKRQFIFIEAAEQFLSQDNQACFLIIGDDLFARDGKYKQELIDRVKSSPFAENIKIIGWQDDLGELWPRFDCLVHTADAEPFGRVIIEAMAHGIGVIAASGGGPAEIIENQRTGLLFESDNIEQLTAAMKTVSQDRELAHQLAANGRKNVISNFKAEKTAEKITNVYKEILAA